jgi:hypothetical protein
MVIIHKLGRKGGIMGIKEKFGDLKDTLNFFFFSFIFVEILETFKRIFPSQFFSKNLFILIPTQGLLYDILPTSKESKIIPKIGIKLANSPI